MAGWKSNESIEESKKVINMLVEENEAWAICLKVSDKVIGSIGLYVTDNAEELMLGYVLSEQFWGNGLIVEASKCVLNYAFNTVSVFHSPLNYQSKRVIEKLGFKYIETKEKSDVIWDVSVYDSVCYMLSREDFNV